MTVTTTYSTGIGSVSGLTSTAGTQTAPGVVTLSNGNVASFYIDGTTLKGQLVNGATGAPVGSAVTVGSNVAIPTYANGVPVATSVAVLANGNIVVTWSNNAGTQDALYRIYDANLTPVTGILAVESLVTSSSVTPDVAAFDDGTFGIVWIYQDEIRYRQFNSAGGALTSEVIVYATGGNAANPSITGQSGGVIIGFDVDGTAAAGASMAQDGTGASVFPFDAVGAIARNVQVARYSGFMPTAFWEDSSPTGLVTDTEVTSFDETNNVRATTQTGNNGALNVATNAYGMHFVTTTRTFSATDLDVNGFLADASGTPLGSLTTISQSSTLDETGAVAAWVNGSSVRVFYNVDTAQLGDPDAGIVQRLLTFSRTSTGDAADDSISFQNDGLNDTMNGGDGNDILMSGFGTDIVSGGTGNDQIYAYGQATVNGGDGDDKVGISALAVSVDGGAGTDTLSISGNLPQLTQGFSSNLTNLWTGGSGTVGSATVSGFETLESVVLTSFNDTFVLGANAPSSITSFGVDGQNGDDVIIGGNNDDKLIGGTGNDVVSGGPGNDRLSEIDSGELIGGTGNDTFVVDSNATSLIELAGEGIDGVEAFTPNFVLPANIENLTFFTTGASVRVGVGNGLDNVMIGTSNSRDQLFGGAGNDTLNDGSGAAGFEDTLMGGPGDDIYQVGVRGSSTIELAGEGTDEVRTTFSIYALQPNIENLTAINVFAHAALVGNTGDNTIRGNTLTDDLFGREGNDSLYGGTGNPNTMLGQQGDDTYHVEAVGDSVIEFAGEGVDTVIGYTSSYTLPTNVENFTYAGPDVVTAIGNASANTMTGGPGGDFLSGLDGADILTGGGAPDTLLGGTSGDQFRYVGNDNVDTIIGFQTGLDKIALSTAFFTPTATGGFVQGSAPVATNGNSTFLYNTATGIVSYDDDGNGAGAAVSLASIGTGLSLAASDFIFF